MLGSSARAAINLGAPWRPSAAWWFTGSFDFAANNGFRPPGQTLMQTAIGLRL